MSKNTKKILLTTFCALVLVAGSVLGTLAYLTDTTDQVKNTFTVGKVDIKLDESKVTWNEQQGKYVKDTETRVTENEYKMLPGMRFPKDPTITVEKGSESCYIGAVVTLTVDDITKTPIWQEQYKNVALTGFVTGGVSTATEWQWSGEGMTYVDGVGNTVTQKVTLGAVSGETKAPDVITFTYVFKNVYKEDDTIMIFDEINTVLNADKWTGEALDAMTITKTVDGNTTESFELTIDGYAVQAESFENAKAALQAAFNTNTAPIF